MQGRYGVLTGLAHTPPEIDVLLAAFLVMTGLAHQSNHPGAFEYPSIQHETIFGTGCFERQVYKRAVGKYLFLGILSRLCRLYAAHRFRHRHARATGNSESMTRAIGDQQRPHEDHHGHRQCPSLYLSGFWSPQYQNFADINMALASCSSVGSVLIGDALINWLRSGTSGRSCCSYWRAVSCFR